MSPSVALPESALCSVASVRISVDLPAPFGPSRPNIPFGTSSETPSSARTPLGYVLQSPEMARIEEVTAALGRRRCRGL
jgi:hypothetical protein